MAALPRGSSSKSDGHHHYQTRILYLPSIFLWEARIGHLIFYGTFFITNTYPVYPVPVHVCSPFCDALSFQDKGLPLHCENH